LLVDETPELVERTRAWADRWDPGASDRLLEAATSSLNRFGNTLIALPMEIVSSVIEFVVVVAMSIYWLLSSRAMGRFVESLLPHTKRGEFQSVAGEVSHAMGGYFRSEGIGAVVVALIVFVVLTLLGIDYAILLALIAGFGELIPVVGPLLAAIPAVGIAFLDSPIKALEVVFFYVVLQQIESNILVPNLMQRQSGLPPLIALFALLVGGTVFGILGAIAALPFAAAMRVLTVEVVVPAVRRWTGAMDQAPVDG
jgi:predicted PurR-regulated permease PerM